MRETSFLRHVYANATSSDHVVVGPGDDCAVLDTGGPDLLLITTDQLIAGRHYDPKTTSPELIAQSARAQRERYRGDGGSADRVRLHGELCARR
ncbi:MAG: hypothetical protein ACFHWZ_11160 [Phycisphaerales bacterium]